MSKIFEFVEHNLYQETYQVIAETEEEAFELWSRDQSKYRTDSYLLDAQEEPYIEVIEDDCKWLWR